MNTGVNFKFPEGYVIFQQAEKVSALQEMCSTACSWCKYIRSVVVPVNWHFVDCSSHIIS